MSALPEQHIRHNRIVLCPDEGPLELDPSGIEAVAEDAPDSGDLPSATPLGLDAISVKVVA